MTRRALIIAGVGLAMVIFVLGLIGYFMPVYRSYAPLSNLRVYVHFAGGLVRVYCLRCDQPFVLEESLGYVNMSVRLADSNRSFYRYYHAPAGSLPPYAWLSNKWQARNDPTAPTLHFFGFRTWIWLPVLLLLIHPILAAARDRIARHRRRAGCCAACGYDLTGNESGVCPECGEDVHANALRYPLADRTH